MCANRILAERRKGPAIICHRGVSDLAPENTLEAYSAAAALGADGIEIDIRRSADAVLYCFHDDRLDRMTGLPVAAYGLSYGELASLDLLYMGCRSGARIPTLAAVIELVRRQSMLLHLDIKEPGIDHHVATVLTESDVWEHVVSINEYNAAALLADPQYKPLRYKAPGMFEDGSDRDIEAVRRALGRPGEMIIVDDPRIAAEVLGRIRGRALGPDPIS